MSLPGLSQPNRSIITGITVLQEVVSGVRPVGSRELARRLGIEHSKVNRILGTLVHMGMLRKTEDRRYESGTGVHVFSAQSLHASGLVQASIAPLRSLQALGATVALGTVWREVVCYLLHAESHQELSSTAGAHETFPVSDSVIGAVLAANQQVLKWDRSDRGEVSWAAIVEESESRPVAAIAAVFPAGHRLANDPSTQERLAGCASQIERALAAWRKHECI